MELIWKEIEAERLICRTKEQVSINGVLPSPDGRTPREIPGCTAKVVIDEAATGTDMVNVRGRICVSVTAIDESGVPFAFESAAKFTHEMEAKNAMAGMTAEVRPVIQSLTVTPSPEGGILSASVDMELIVVNDAPLRVTGGISGVEDLETKYEKVCVCRRVQVGREDLRLREEIAAEGVEDVISAEGAVCVRETVFEQGAATVSGTVTVSAVTLDGSGRMAQIVRQIPFRERIAVDSKAGGLYCTAELGSLYLRALGAEFAVIAMEAEIGFTVYGIQKSELELPVDAFSPTIAFDCLKEDITFISHTGAAAAQTTIRETVYLPASAPEIASPLFAFARPVITEAAAENGTLNISGVLLTTVVYESDTGRSYTFMDEIPFEAVTEAGADVDRADVESSCTASITGYDTGSVQVQYNLVTETQFSREIRCSAAVGLAETERKEKSSGIVVCFASEGETAFDAAKRWSVPSADVRKINPDAEEPYKEGQGLIILL